MVAGWWPYVVNYNKYECNLHINSALINGSVCEWVCLCGSERERERRSASIHLPIRLRLIWMCSSYFNLLDKWIAMKWTSSTSRLSLYPKPVFQCCLFQYYCFIETKPIRYRKLSDKKIYCTIKINCEICILFNVIL